DAVVHHLDEVPGPGRAAVEIPALGGAPDLLASRRPRRGAESRSERGEDGIEALHRLGLAADHEAESTLEHPHPTARPHVHVMQSAWLELAGPADVVVIVRVAAVDDHVVG